MGHPNVQLNTAGAPVASANPLPVTPVQAAAAAGTKAAFVRGLKAPADIAVPEALAAAGTYVTSVMIYAQRAGRVANATAVYIDAIAANDAQLIALAPGASILLTAPPGKYIDLGDLYVDAGTLTDGVFFLGLL